MQTIALINASTDASTDDLTAAATALQIQIDRDFGPEWGAFAKVDVFTHDDVANGNSPSDAWWVTLLDTSDAPGAAGYHDLTPEGRPAAKVFVRTEKNAGADWRVCLSHEVLEMLADPDVNRVVFPSSTRAVSLEVCDPPEADQFGYKIGDVPVSNFVTRAWFESFRGKDECPFDFRGILKTPFSLLPGGYMSVLDLTIAGEGWRQRTNDIGLSEVQKRRLRPHSGSRREKRRLSPESWLRSTVGAKGAVPQHGRAIWI